jgi:hypothetical protein
MSHKDNADLRNTGDGGWFYAEHELFSVFVPLIGPLGGMVYMAMCRLIPLAAVDPDKQVTLRRIEEESGVNRQTANRKRVAIVAMGMVEEMKRGTNRVSTYKLVSLRKLAAVGVEELKRRLEGLPGVSVADTENEGGGSDPVSQQGHAVAEGRVVGADAIDRPTLVSLLLPDAPAASGGNGVSQRDTDPSLCKNGVSAADSGESVSQNRASVSQNRASVSQNRASVSHFRGPYKEEEEEEDKTKNTPLPPASGGSASSTFTPCVQATNHGNGESKNFPDEGHGQASDIEALLRGVTPSQKLAAQLVWATAQVMRAHSFTPDARMEEAISKALGLWCSKTQRTPGEAVALEAANFGVYREHSGAMSYGWGWRWWFKRGYWSKPEQWPYDREKLAQMRRADVGRNPNPSPGQEGA